MILPAQESEKKIDQIFFASALLQLDSKGDLQIVKDSRPFFFFWGLLIGCFDRDVDLKLFLCLVLYLWSCFRNSRRNNSSICSCFIQGQRSSSWRNSWEIFDRSLRSVSCGNCHREALAAPWTIIYHQCKSVTKRRHSNLWWFFHIRFPSLWIILWLIASCHQITACCVFLIWLFCYFVIEKFMTCFCQEAFRQALRASGIF